MSEEEFVEWVDESRELFADTDNFLDSHGYDKNALQFYREEFEENLEDGIEEFGLDADDVAWDADAVAAAAADD